MNPEVLRAQAQRMLKDHKSVRLVDSFTVWLQLDKIDSAQPDPHIFSLFYRNKLDELLIKAQYQFDYMLQGNRDIGEFIDDYTFINKYIAELWLEAGKESSL